jgi:cytochrome c oxidase subunit III
VTPGPSPFASSERGDPRTEREDALPGAGVLGMWIFLATLAVLFIASIVGYLIVRLAAPHWPPVGMPRLPSGLWAATAVILLCSATVHRALVDVRRGQKTASARWLLATIVLGVLFLLVQAWNWWGLVTLDLGLRARNLYAFTFYMLTGLHAAHVVGGLGLLAIVAWRAARGRYGSGHHPGVTYAAMYWHFLDVMWLLLFTVLVIFA